jgi:sigma-B regulation protein RsbU (phosphoserine phosphatase)
MQLRKLYKTIESFGTQKFENHEDFLKHILAEIVQNEEIKIKGGRIWKFDPKNAGYELIHQIGDIEKITAHYRIKLKDNPIFLELPKLRTIIASEQDQYLRQRGIGKYSATGIGERIHWRGNTLYKYVMAFNADELGENLTATLNIISQALNSMLRATKIEQKAKTLERDLDKAREIQQSILPQHELHFHKYDIYGVSVPDRIVGGDFFDYLQLDDDAERLGVVIGDATSKGMSAAVEALYLSGALRMGFEYQTKISLLLSRVNKLLHKTFSEEHFVSLFYAEITDDRTGLLIYANCGHNTPMLLRAGERDPLLLEATGQMLGPFPESTFKTESVLMKKGDLLLLYTDGITEATNEQGEFYGEERLLNQLRNCRDMTPKEMTQRMLQEVQLFNSTGTNSDDKTIVVLKRSQ